MTDDEPDGEETVILTRRDRRRGAVADAPPADAPGSDAPPAEASDADAPAGDVSDAGLDEATVVVVRGAARPDASTDVPDQPAAVPGEWPGEAGEPAAGLDEATVVVVRGAARKDASTHAPDEPSVEAGEPEAGLDEATVVVDRSAARPVAPTDVPDEPSAEAGEPAGGLDEATVVVDRSAARPGAPTTELADEPAGESEDPSGDRDEPVGEATVAVDRRARGLLRKRKPGGDPAPDSPSPEPAATVISFEAPTEAPTPAIYRPRPAPQGPAAPPVVVGAAAPSRDVDPDLPSVAKQGLRWSRATLLAFAGACVVSVAGLVALGVVVFV